ncbi:hypothetical protein SGFS_038230 [Streptomyces graminofaciens]|uniref:WXG100 family type VII secretion target n=1 Tax=Streptomyces graminofaciens TaxID=68212 RepID=A0ABN5VH46_9ACTN|nr:WXG100 family type VII secretion target [Streptomyces graminofaciens]BBC32529.1 hypothetical protein SGFS_038230 [Streptomyces graminofaciens]
MSGNGKGLSKEDQELISLANEIRNFHVDVSTRVSKLNTVVDNIQAGWQGIAGATMNRTQQGVNANLRTLQDNLVDLEEVMRMAVGSFEDFEQDRISAIRKVDDSQESQAAVQPYSSSITSLA